MLQALQRSVQLPSALRQALPQINAVRTAANFRTKVMAQVLRDLFAEDDSPFGDKLETLRWRGEETPRMGGHVT